MPKPGEAKVRGYRELARGSEELADDIGEAARQAFLGVATDAAGATSMVVPRLTGALAGSTAAALRSARAKTEGARVSIGKGVPYAGWIEFGGTRNRPFIPGGRYLYPTALDVTPQLEAVGEDSAKRKIGGIQMATTDLGELEPGTLPAYVAVSQTPDIRFTPNEMRRLKQMTGHTMTQLMGEEAAEEDRLQAMVWLQLVREGHDPSWDEAGDVAIRFEVDEPDPTNGAS